MKIKDTAVTQKVNYGKTNGQTSLPDLTQSKVTIWRQVLQAPVIIAALGYFVDIYDLLLFSIVRIPSLKALGLSGDLLMKEGIFLINVQMAGLITGGILWGILGDKRGRLSVLFGSILMYSLANIANGFVTSVPQYAILRFIAGVGLAGELGAGITLVAEILPKHIRGYGTTLVAAVGLFGAVLAYFVAQYTNWMIAYWIGGAMGLSLLLLRYTVAESGMFAETKQKDIKRGNFFLLFSNKQLFLNYLRCVFIGLPIWYVIGILITFSPEFAASLNMPEPVEAGKAVMFCYIGLSIGDLNSGTISQYLKSRKKVVLLFILLTAAAIVLYLTISRISVPVFYGTCFFLGFAIGYWAPFCHDSCRTVWNKHTGHRRYNSTKFCKGDGVASHLFVRNLKIQYEYGQQCTDCRYNFHRHRSDSSMENERNLW